jgi:hypothetical protein
MKLGNLLLLAAICLNTGWADFSNSSIQVHPLYPEDGPFILEITGEWPSDCHPGEQLPVVKAFDETSVSIEFEFIIIHITCNDVITPYRVLVDLSDVVRTGVMFADMLELDVTFGEITMRQSVTLVCPQGMDCDEHSQAPQRPDPGIYEAPELANQGILVARQDTGMGVFPLSYDEAGMPEWLVTGGHMAGDSFFGKITRWRGGDCFGCEPTGANPEKSKIGTLSVLVDGPGLLQVKVDDNMFREYRSLVYGYEKLRVGPFGEQTLIDLEGRWGLIENRGTNPPLGDLTEFLPGAFDLVLEDFVKADSSIQQDGQVSYLFSTPTGDVLGQLVCKGQTGLDGTTNVCEFIDPTDAAEPLFLFYQDGPSSLSIEYGRAVIAIGVAPGGRAVRLD